MMAKVKVIAVLLLTMGLAAGTGALTCQIPRGEQTETQPKAQAAPPGKPNKNEPPTQPMVRTDALGDPLPPGAVARMGTLRLYHFGWVSRLVFSADNKTVATAEVVGQTLRLWDVATGKELRRVKGFTCSDKVAYAPNGKTLACSTASNAGEIRLRDPATGEEILDLPGHREELVFVSFSQDGKTLRTSDSNRVIGFWDVATGKPSSPLRPPPRYLRFPNDLSPAVISRDGRLASALDADNRILLWQPASAKIIHQFAGPPASWKQFTGSPASWKQLAFSPDGAMLVSGGGDHTAVVWDMTSIADGDRAPTERQAIWNALGGSDAARAYKAMCSLIHHPSTVPFLRQHLHAIAAPDAARIARLVEDLDSDEFAVRERANGELDKLGELSAPALRKALTGRPTLEKRRRVEQLLQKLREPVTNPEQLQVLRSVEVLEHIGTAEACRLLATLANGAAEARLTQEVKASLARLAAWAGRRP